MASQYPPDAHRPQDVSQDKTPDNDDQPLQTDHVYQECSDQDRRDFVRNIDWASF